MPQKRNLIASLYYLGLAAEMTDCALKAQPAAKR